MVDSDRSDYALHSVGAKFITDYRFMNALVWKCLTLGLVTAVVSGAFYLASVLHELPRSPGFQLVLVAANQAAASPAVVSAQSSQSPQWAASAAVSD